MRDFYKMLETIQNNPDKRFSLATIFRVQGSSYRKAGAKMLIGEDGQHIGTISAGCLEGDLFYHALASMKQKETKIVTYDLMAEDDLGWGQGAGCNGIIDVFVEPFYWADCPSLYEKIMEAMRQGEEVVSVKRLGDNIYPQTLYYSMEFELLGAIGDGDIADGAFVDKVKQLAGVRNKKEIPTFSHEGKAYIVETHLPKDLLYVFGAGPDAEPLVKFASSLDFHITVIDPRSARCNRDFLAAAAVLVVEHPKIFLRNYKMPHNSYCIVMTHHFQRDKEIMEQLKDRPLKYLGFLGPRSRTERLCAPDPLPERIHSPIGIEIFAEGAEEISISILSELIKIRNSHYLMKQKA